jgi:hypothetical protein
MSVLVNVQPLFELRGTHRHLISRRREWTDRPAERLTDEERPEGVLVVVGHRDRVLDVEAVGRLLASIPVAIPTLIDIPGAGIVVGVVALGGTVIGYLYAPLN